jgi:serine/threonine protein kinase
MLNGECNLTLIRPQAHPFYSRNCSKPYVALKIGNCSQINFESAQRELEISKTIASANPQHKGFEFVRLLLDNFEVKGPEGSHMCYVYEPMREPLSLFQKRLSDAKFSLDSVKYFLTFILQGLDYLHSECHIVHTGMLWPPGPFSILVSC